jgi:hypothetical protein
MPGFEPHLVVTVNPEIPDHAANLQESLSLEGSILR